jgi:peptidoglycan/xylan/chitin deacetylase (PgdA/CDA1 family)
LLSSLKPDDQSVEIGKCKLLLEDFLGHPVDLFSYPYGRPEDVPARARRIAKAAGYHAAVTTVQGAVTRRTPVHALSRLTVFNWTPHELLDPVRALFRDA